MPPAGSLTAEQLSYFDAHGEYVVLESFSSAEEVQAMRGRMAELVDGFDGANSTVFSTKDHRQVKDDYFFKSAENISFFFEALHELDPVFKKFAFSENVSSLFSSVGYKRRAITQSMYIFKQPGIGGEVVPPHQDNTFLYTDPPSCIGFWLALKDGTITNDGLKRRMIRDENGTHFDHPFPPYDQKEFVLLEVKSGALVVIHGDLVHQSFENLSPVSRHALSLGVVDTEGEGCEWSKENWLQRNCT